MLCLGISFFCRKKYPRFNVKKAMFRGFLQAVENQVSFSAKKFKPYILKYKALILKYVPCVFCKMPYVFFGVSERGVCVIIVSQNFHEVEGFRFYVARQVALLYK